MIAQNDKVSFSIWTLNEDIVGTEVSRPLYESDGKYSNVSSHYRPVIELSTNIVIDQTDSNRNGSSPELAWKIALR